VRTALLQGMVTTFARRGSQALKAGGAESGGSWRAGGTDARAEEGGRRLAICRVKEGDGVVTNASATVEGGLADCHVECGAI
jgi:hypothetical protein